MILSDSDLTIIQYLFYHYREEYRLAGDELDLFQRVLRERGVSEEFIESLECTDTFNRGNS